MKNEEKTSFDNHGAEEIEVMPPRTLTVRDAKMIKYVAGSVERSRKLGLRKDEAAIKMYVALEHGFPVTSAFSIVHIVENTPSLAPKAIWAKIINHPDFEGFNEQILTTENGDFHGYVAILKRRGLPEIARTFTMDDARRIKTNRARTKSLADKMNYQNYPLAMCQWRAMGYVIDVLFPDVAFGLMRATDLGAGVNDDWDLIIEGEVVPDNLGPSEYDIAYAELMERHTVADVLGVLGRKPVSVDEISELLDILDNGEEEE